MKIRKIIFGLALLLAASTSFAFKSKPFGWPASYTILGHCSSGGVTSQVICSEIVDGPQCTVIVGNKICPAYVDYGFDGDDCLVPLKYNP